MSKAPNLSVRIEMFSERFTWSIIEMGERLTYGRKLTWREREAVRVQRASLRSRIRRAIDRVIS